MWSGEKFDFLTFFRLPEIFDLCRWIFDRQAVLRMTGLTRFYRALRDQTENRTGVLAFAYGCISGGTAQRTATATDLTAHY